MTKKLSDHDIKVLLSLQVLNLENKAKENILRDIIFSGITNINWQLVLKSINREMPEMKKEYYRLHNRK